MGGLILVEEKVVRKCWSVFPQGRKLFSRSCTRVSDSGRELSFRIDASWFNPFWQRSKWMPEFNGANSPTEQDFIYSWAAEPAIFFNISTAL